MPNEHLETLEAMERSLFVMSLLLSSVIFNAGFRVKTNRIISVLNRIKPSAFRLAKHSECNVKSPISEPINLWERTLKETGALRRFVERAQNEIAVVPDFHKRILFSDEAYFWLNGYVNKENCRIWSEANPQVYVETPLHPEKLTVWCALWAGGILLQKR
ncbi:DUF4817 domain-containing protein [Trichonephila clavipes]|nr:DUF4817 domain-containing protein [Trichonephila clavipes]